MSKARYTCCKTALRTDGRYYTRFIGPRVSKYVWYQAGVTASNITAEEVLEHFWQWVKATDEYISKEAA